MDRAGICLIVFALCMALMTTAPAPSHALAGGKLAGMSVGANIGEFFPNSDAYGMKGLHSSTAFAIEGRFNFGYRFTPQFLKYFGAGAWGFAQTLPQINKWTHGTRITASHGHFAFFGAYVMLVMTLVYFMVPQ